MTPIDGLEGHVAGWEDSGGDWHNVEAGDREPALSDLEESPRIVVAVEGFGDETTYLTSSYWTEDFGLEEVIEEADESDHYGEA